ncbi:bifunctional UDP-sugar hydrolase/5'-nucleotidase [Corynebacterium sp. MSK008]|uniref:bifunctional metallophosphatase/5'-nucleotidase n=1 Tax=Corynebacterium sp. MSK008 TaxID=3050188 RepID=UPI00254AC57C|nr:bifunctional UDP-sugar hydrolase/5'-nucleotidase [Corynebacterium sp. MSK008]MDK8879624.1 bifunctional UDP-sugar hydrolase/5'-nucleotidase [Corynebacterium sp. MSK008]
MFDFRRAGALIAATTTTAVVLTAAPFAAAAEADQVTINVANITDFHGRLKYNPSTTTVKDAAGNPVLDENGKEVKEITPKAGDEMGAANVAGIMNYLREQNPNTIVTTSGDNQGGSAFISFISDDKYTMDFINAIGTDGSAVGNHEFDKGYKDLIDRIVPGTNDKQLGANIFVDGKQAVDPYTIVEKDGVKVALVGTTSNLTPEKSSPANVAGVEFTDSAEQVNVEAKKIKESGKADLVIALIHDPAHTSAPKLNPEYVDFIFGGDDHIKRLELDRDGKVPYAQSHEYGKVVTDIAITYDTATKEIVDVDGRQIDATHLEELGITPDPEVEKIVEEADKIAKDLGQRVVANIAADFKRGSNPEDKPGSNRGTESTANNMLAQSAVAALSAFLDTEIDFGVMNAGGVRADLSKGDVTYEQAANVQPFGNNIAVATLSGAAIKEALENQWQTPEATEKSGRPRLDMGLSDNVSYTYNPNAERGNRILDIQINGESVDPEKDYTVAASTFLLDGGDALINADEVHNRNDVGYNDLQAFVDYLQTGDATVRAGQKDVGVVLPEGGLKAGQKNIIELTSLSYSSEGEAQAETVTAKVAEATATANVDNAVTDADNGFGEQGRAKVELEIPAGVSGEQTLEITTDAGTKVSLPVTVAQADKPAEDNGKDKPAKENGSSDAPIGVILGVIAAVLALLLPLALAFPIDSVLGPIALLNNNK